MKHSKNYIDSLNVVENPNEYDIRDVEKANAYIEAYQDGFNQALKLT